MSTKATTFLIGAAAAAGLAAWFAEGGEKAHQAPKLVSRASEKFKAAATADAPSPSYGYAAPSASTADQAREVCMGD
ncbi:hypothetical protein KFE25_000078 [Diacronema lutheri]|uniref:Uncharacterized protein n=1 Tax=Diacronema lutheri TaxID=2081491 RepID=A0A8J6CBP5_DIALT|nr:hypothetical protein KFE25_000078 [Diacronema lutheri]